MSQYATRAEFDKYGLPTSVTTGVSDATINAYLEATSSVADDYLRAGYDLPLAAPYPLSLKRAVCHIAAFDYMSSIGYSPESGNDTVIEDRAEMAMKWLRDIGSGKAQLEGITDETPGVNEDAPEVFSNESSRGY